MYLLGYVQGCSPKLKVFRSKKALLRFIDAYKQSPDDWIDFYVKIDGKPVIFDLSK